MSCAYFCLSQNVMLTSDFIHSWSSVILHIADCPSFFSCLLWFGLLVFVPPLLHPASPFWVPPPLPLSLTGAFWCSFYMQSTCDLIYFQGANHRSLHSSVDLGLSSRVIHSLSIDECPSVAHLPPPRVPLLAVPWPGEWMALTLTTAGMYSCEELIQN